MPTATLQRLFLVISLLFVSTQPGMAQIENTTVAESDEQVSIETWYKIYDSIGSSFQVRQKPTHKSELNSEDVDLNRQRLLNLTNPNNSRHGQVYLWTNQGRPVVIGAVKSVHKPEEPENRQVFYTFISVSQSAVNVGRDDKVFWKCAIPGIKWHDEIEKTPPSANRTTRLSQMKSIARRFTVENRNTDGSTSAVFQLMPTPIYRYPEETTGVTDGSIFAFSTATEPHAYMLIEARSNSWHVAFARDSSTKKAHIKNGNEDFLILEESMVARVGGKHKLSRNDHISEIAYLKWIAERRLISDPEKVVFQAD